MRCLIVPLMLAALSTTAFADGVVVQTDALQKAYNKVAKKLGLPSRMTLKKCTNEAGFSCSYGISGNVAAIGEGSSDDHKLAVLTIISASDSEPLNVLVAYGVAMAIFSPDADKTERGEALTQLLSDFDKSENHSAQVKVDSARYRMMSAAGLGLWFVVQPSSPSTDDEDSADTSDDEATDQQ